MSYTIFDVESGNAVDSFADEDAALGEMRAAIAAHGPGIAVSWILIAYSAATGERREIAEGDELVSFRYNHRNATSWG